MKYFGTDGIRGIPNQKLNVEFIVKVGRALSILKLDHIIVGTDTRESKDMIAYALIAGALSQGLYVDYVEVIPTPGILYLSKIKNAVGVMITASHNPYFYNGIKIIKKGKKLTKQEEEQMESFLDSPLQRLKEVGRLTLSSRLVKEYHKMLFPHLASTHLKLAVDCANGATYKIAPLIFNLITNSLVVLHNEPNGRNINEQCGSTCLKSLSNTVVQERCDLGIAFDGDGDRVVCVDKNGIPVDGDLILYILACYLKGKNLLKNNAIAITIMSNLGIIRSLNKKGIRTIETPVGDKYIAEAIQANDLSLGGESSGHIIFPEISSTGDGILIAMKLIQILEETHTTIEDWISDLILYPDKLENIMVKDKKRVLGVPLQNQIEEMKKELHQDCKIIVRPSGTEDCIRVSVMAQTEELVSKYQDRLVSLIRLLDAS